ncbi:MAG: glutaminyl-peptide cyclotransferase [bacterium]
MHRYLTYFIIIFTLLLFSCKQNGDLAKQKSQEFEVISKDIDMLEGKNEQSSTNNSDSKAPAYDIKVINVYPHDSLAYTQGFLYYYGYFYESTGLTGHSSLRKVEVETGKILKNYKVKGGYFGEGIEIYKDKIYQLTWASQTCFVYNLETLELVNSFSYRGEGWGLTKINNELIMSNGTSKLKYIKPENFSEIRTLEVKDENYSVYYLNELEYINGEIWANIYQTKRIARINPETGKVNSWIDLSPLSKYVSYGDSPDVLNGIAYDKEKKRIFVTGKLWKFVFEIEIIEK